MKYGMYIPPCIFIIITPRVPKLEWQWRACSHVRAHGHGAAYKNGGVKNCGLASIGSTPASGLCNACEGDCDSNRDCAGHLTCSDGVKKLDTACPDGDAGR